MCHDMCYLACHYVRVITRDEMCSLHMWLDIHENHDVAEVATCNCIVTM